jgi:NCAIR mutase (PurE)-related protein
LTPEYLKKLLLSHKSGELGTEEVLEELSSLPFEELDFAKLDYHRMVRTGYPEVIFGQGKTPEQGAVIFKNLAKRNSCVLSTRTNLEVASAMIEAVPKARYLPECEIVLYQESEPEKEGLVVVACAGTTDLRVAKEAAVVCEAFGSRVELASDVGVAGIHRVLGCSDILREANCIIVVAGMEGALPSVVAGMVAVPVIAVPTSVGYGASFGGLAALLAMLNSCASGVSVVNIDNGFGAAIQADMINKLAERTNVREENNMLGKD